MENNSIEHPSFPLCRKIVLALGITYEQLFTFEEKREETVIDFACYKNKKLFTQKEAADIYSDCLDDSQKYIITKMMIYLTEQRTE